MTVIRAALLLVLGVAAVPARGAVALPHVFGDHMVLQRDTPVRVWGTAEPGERVAVTLGTGRAAATAGQDRRWEVKLPAMKAGGPYTLVAEGADAVTVRDVMIGEVWFCSGQSNMALPVLKTLDFDREIAAADHPGIRFVTTPTREAKEPQPDARVEWKVCSPKTIAYTSGTAYYFGRELHRKLGVPVGLIISAVNGTRIEPWTPASGIAGVKELAGKDEARDGDLYNGMVHPFTPYTIRGFIWYQGEGNVGDGVLYYHRMRALVGGWRASWGLGELPFYYVQLTPLNWGGKPKELHAELWDAQRAALAIPGTGMVVTTDIVGNVGEAHPRNKQEVGRRLALWAFAKTYGLTDVAYSGPLFKSVTREGGALRVAFDFADGLATPDGMPLNWFAVAGVDGTFFPAEAVADGDTVVVRADGVKAPVAVRFGWHQTAQPNLINRYKLPASPFRAEIKQGPARTTPR